MKAAAVALVAVLTACRGSSSATSGSSRPQGAVRVFAAASLTGPFREMAEAFEAENPAVNVDFNFAASSALARQVVAGAPADVVVTADERTMQTVIDNGDALGPKTLARNRLTIVVEKGNPEGVSGLRDLARPNLVVVLCAPEVPCGRLADAALQMAGVHLRPASREQHVKAVTAKVVLGEADAGIVYVTDARAEGDKVGTVAIDSAADHRLEAVYVIATARHADNPAAALAWVDFAVSAEGQAVLARHGFLPP